MLHVAIWEEPIPWARMRGGHARWKPEDLRAWQDHVRDVVLQEIALTDAYASGPYEDPSVMVLAFATKSKKFDLDNGAKAILDALKHVLYPDDSKKYIKGLIVFGTEPHDDQPPVQLWHLPVTVNLPSP